MTAKEARNALFTQWLDYIEATTNVEGEVKKFMDKSFGESGFVPNHQDLVAHAPYERSYVALTTKCRNGYYAYYHPPYLIRSAMASAISRFIPENIAKPYTGLLKAAGLLSLLEDTLGHLVLLDETLTPIN